VAVFLYLKTTTCLTCPAGFEANAGRITAARRTAVDSQPMSVVFMLDHLSSNEINNNYMFHTAEREILKSKVLFISRSRCGLRGGFPLFKGGQGVVFLFVFFEFLPAPGSLCG
jgi:hypothetical protein